MNCKNINVDVTCKGKWHAGKQVIVKQGFTNRLDNYRISSDRSALGVNDIKLFFFVTDAPANN